MVKRTVRLLGLALFLLAGCARPLEPVPAPLPTVAPPAAAAESASPAAPGASPTVPVLSADTPAPTSAPGQPIDFTVKDLNLVPPEDVLREIAFFGGLGGGSGDEGGGGCSAQNYSSPNFLEKVEEIEVMKGIFFTICKISTSQSVQIAVTFPGGMVKTFSTDTHSEGDGNYQSLYFDYMPDFRDPKGEYQFEFTGQGWSLKQTVRVRDSSQAHLFEEDTNKITLYKFQPLEYVRLLVYSREGTAKFLGWKQVQVDSSGQLTLTGDWSTARLAAIGDQSGPVDDLLLPTLFHSGGTSFYCPGAPVPAMLDPYKPVKVISPALPLYLSPGGEQRRTLGTGTLLYFTWNQECKDQRWWWPVRCAELEACSGYVQEGDFGGPFLRTIDEKEQMFSVHVLDPVQYDPQEAPSLWSLASFQDLSGPGTRTYAVAVDPNEHYRWTFAWCAASRDILQTILAPLSIQFKVDGRPVSDTHITIQEDQAMNGMVCKKWTLLLGTWQYGITARLDISYSLSSPINDGKTTYPAGAYHQVIEASTH